MAWTTDNLKESITYWDATGVDNFGDPTFASPITVKAKWEERTEIFINAEGQEERSRSVIYVDSNLITGGYIFRGISTVADPRTVDDAYLIKDYRKISNFENTIHERRVML